MTGSYGSSDLNVHISLTVNFWSSFEFKKQEDFSVTSLVDNSLSGKK